MALKPRERNLLVGTIILVLAGLTYLLAAPLWRRWQSLDSQLLAQKKELEGMKAHVSRAPQWQQEYNKLRETLGQGEQVFSQTSDVLRKIEEVGASAGILISSRRPMLPVDKGVYRELPVQCSFEATTEALVKFLYGLQTSSGFVNVEQLQIYPRPDNPNLLRCDIQIRALAGKGEVNGS
jgi:Tfp pilus assembly protein PilO